MVSIPQAPIQIDALALTVLNAPQDSVSLMDSVDLPVRTPVRALEALLWDVIALTTMSAAPAPAHQTFACLLATSPCPDNSSLTCAPARVQASVLLTPVSTTLALLIAAPLQVDLHS